jgi:uncharacterized protein (DUF58 family)
VPRIAQPEGIRITRVGFWYVVFSVVVAVAATNTGNNALYLVLAAMLALLVVSGLVSRSNLRRLTVELEIPAELYASRPFRVLVEVRSTARYFPRWLLVCALSHGRVDHFVPYLAAGRTSAGAVDLMLPRRGIHPIRSAHLWSVFPLGFFRKGLRYRLDRTVLVFPELFSEAGKVEERAARHGEDGTDRRGWGQELHSMREYRRGDDPRSIHWKRSASSGGLVFMEREAEEGRRLSIVFDNGVAPVPDGSHEARFERLVSEAATAAHQYLRAGYEVELVTRGGSLEFGTGPAHRRRVLEHLALIEPVEAGTAGLRGSDPRAPELRLSMRDEAAA